MNDMIQSAHERLKHLEKCIAEKETEISDFKEEAEKIHAFLNLADELFSDGPAQETAPQKPARPETPAELAPQPAPQPAPQHTMQKPAEIKPAAQVQRTMPAREPRAAQ